MRNNIVSALVIAATLGMGGAAMAQTYGGNLDNVVRTNDMVGQQVTGVITHVNETDRTVTLADGKTYLLPFGYNVGLLLNGQKVALNVSNIGGQMQVKGLSFSAS